MQRYTVTIVSGGVPGERPTLLIPFNSNALVTAFIDTLFDRIARQGIPLRPHTHIATLHLDSETGAIIDCEDLLSSVILDPRSETLFAVFAEKVKSLGQPAAGATGSLEVGPTISVRVITPALAKSGGASVIQLPLAASISALHKSIAAHLRLPDRVAEDDTNECNCELARKLADGPSPPTHFFFIHAKSTVQRFNLPLASEASLKEVLREHFGQDVEGRKKLNLFGAEMHSDGASGDGSAHTYRKSPVAALCSKHRHIPMHAKVSEEDNPGRKTRVLDLHTSEAPIHPASMDATIESAGLQALAVDGVVDIFAVSRLAADGLTTATIGRSSIFRDRPHWEPLVSQTERGMAMFLSSLRVFASIVQDTDEESAQDAVLHVVDLLFASFPPALRSLYVLVQGRTPTPTESAALSLAMFEVLDGFMPTDVIGTTHSRVFEGSRLLFGFILEKARALRLAESSTGGLPYMAAFRTVDLKDHMTTEAVMRATRTTDGLMEESLYDAFTEGGLLANGHLQPHVVQTDVDATLARVALLTAGSSSEVLVYSVSSLRTNYQYEDAGRIGSVIDLTELSELHHLADLCGRNKLAVHKPSQLSSAINPSLTFDRKAHLAVYTGEQPCGDPGKSSLQFRPHHGKETIDASIIEQLIAPVLQMYEADGTAVFDALGGAAVRRLQAPDECLMFVVDTSASMRTSCDFEDYEAGDEDLVVPEAPTAQSLVEPEHYNTATLDALKESLCSYEAFDDLLAIIAETTGSSTNKRGTASRVVDILRTMLSRQIVITHRDLEKRRERAGRRWHLGQGFARLEKALETQKIFWAGLKTHEESILDFLIYRASTASAAVNQRWTWSLGEQVPTAMPPHNIQALCPSITEVPDELKCPISHALMEDAVTASDHHTYSRAAIVEWFRIRHSSPMHGLPLSDTSLVVNGDLCDAVSSWIAGGELVAADVPTPKKARPVGKAMEITFVSSVGSFTRRVPSASSLDDLYTVAFRGLKARYEVFQLTLGDSLPLPPSKVTLTAKGIRSGACIHIRIADDVPVSAASSNQIGTVALSSGELCLVKVYESADHMLFGYWGKKTTPITLTSIIWKFWRYKLRNHTSHVEEQQVWTDLENSGDGLVSGQPQKDSDNLSHYLNHAHCSGHLGAEKLYREPASSARGSDEPLVLKVLVSTPWQPKHRSAHKLSRLEVLKQMFEALINRMLAYNYKTHVGLIQVGSTASLAMPMSHVLENFRKATNDLEARGDTALHDALALARDQLVEYGVKYPAVRKRIIVISDGCDTKSTNTSEDVCWKLFNSQIVVDSVALGSETNRDLRTTSYMLGGYAFAPSSLVNALAICEMEPFLAITERPTITLPRNLPTNRLQYFHRFSTAKYQARDTVVSSTTIPPRKEHPNMQDEFVELTAAAVGGTRAAHSGNVSSRSNMRLSRLMNEMRRIVANGPHPKYSIFISETDFSFWKVVMSGPEESPYEDGTFLMYLHMEEGSYPTSAPKARFVTKIMHPNVNAHGRICHSIFDRDWTSDTSISTLLDTVYGLLLQADTAEVVNTTTTLGYHHDQVDFADQVREHCAQHAARTREEWKAILLGAVDDSEDN